MFHGLKSFYSNICEKGLKLPFIYDAVSKLPSVTLFFAYVTFLVMLVSLICLHFFGQILQATIASILVWVLAVIFYRMRELDKINLNLKTGSIDLEDTPDEKDNNETK